MTGITHRLAGAAAGIMLVDFLHIENAASSLLMLGGCILGSLVPDIDNPRSTISYKIPTVRLFIGFIQSLIRFISNLLPQKQKSYVRSSIGHRGISHSLLGAIVLPVLTKIIGEIFEQHIDALAIGLLTGLLSHIVLDLFSGGTHLLLPFSSKIIRIMKIRTNGPAEWLIRFSFVCLLAVLIV